MNFTTLVSSVCVSLAITSVASAQWASSGSVLNIGVGGVYGSGSRTVVGPNGQRHRESYSTNTTAFNVGFGAGAASGNGYVPVYGGYGVAVPPPVVMPYYGGQCVPVYVPYNPFTRTYGNPCYVPQVPPCVPAAFCSQMPICW